jgi:hypothetical protein
VVVLAIALGLSACGSPKPQNALAGVAPAQAVSRAVDGLGHGSYRFQGAQTMEMDFSGMPSSLRHGHASVVDVHQTMTGDVESLKRFSGELTSAGHTTVRIVLYDGTTYISRDGVSWLEAPFLTNLVGQMGAESIQQQARQLDAVHDTGRVRTRGVDAEHFDATLSAGFFDSVMKQMAGPLSSSFGAPPGVMDKALVAMHVDRFTMGFDIARATGQLVDTTSSGQMSIDMTELASVLGAPPSAGLSGVMRIRIDSVDHRYDGGGHIAVHRPASSGTMSFQEFATLLSSGHTS